jgi:hypothetical protein
MAKNKRYNEPPIDVAIEVDGKTHRGSYRVEGGMVYVSSADGQKATHLGRLPAQRVAEVLLSSLVVDAEQRRTRKA